MDSTGTPTTGTNCIGGAGLGAAKPNAAWTNAQDYSNDINGGNDESRGLDLVRR